MHQHREIGWLAARVLAIAICLFVFQLIFALLTGSLSLLSDTAHVGGDTFAMLILIVAQVTAHRIDKLNGEMEGNNYHNVELLATAVNGLILITAGIYLSFEAISRLDNPPDVSGIILVPGIIGIAVNLLMFWMLSGKSHHMTVQSAAAHVMVDSIASAGVIIAGLLIITTGESLVDPVVSFFIISAIVLWGMRLISLPILAFNSQNHESAI